MNAVQRFLATMRYEPCDRPPLFDEGMRDDVLDRWRSEGLPPNTSPAAIFHYDERIRIDPDVRPRIEVSRVLSGELPLSALVEDLDPEDNSRLPGNLDRPPPARANRHEVVDVFVSWGFFQNLGVGAWASLEPVLYAIADEPTLVRSVMDVYAAFTARLLERILDRCEVDMVTFSEPISATHGPLISLPAFRELVLDSYGPVIDVARRYNVPTILFATYANSRLLLRDVVDAGFNCLWAMETETNDMNYRSIRKEFGRDLGLIGGIDLDRLLLGPRATKDELERNAVPLLEDGGYIPLADGRIRSTMSFENYRTYRRMLEGMVA